MDSILGEQMFFMMAESGPPEAEIFPLEKDSLWIIDGDIIRPSVKVAIHHKLDPGIYSVDNSRDYGVYCKKVNISSDELFNFSESQIPALLAQISLFWDKTAAYKENKLIHKRGILLEGYPGSGKTSIISLLCNDIIKRGGIVFNITDANNLAIYTTFIKNSFRQIEPTTPIITIIEDIDKYADSEIILDFLDGKSQIEHHLVIATTNNTQQIPDSFLRPSRIDLKIEVPLPNEKIRREYFENKKVPSELLEELVQKTQDCSLADLKEVYITIFVLDYPFEEAIKKVKTPQNKKDFTTKKLKTSMLGI
jgi:ATP-dependent 26S proteasome regulatory subunit